MARQADGKRIDRERGGRLTFAAMNAHHDFRRDPETATRQVRFVAEWDRQWAALPQAERDMIEADPAGVLAEGLGYSVERALSRQQSVDEPPADVPPLRP